MRHPTAASLWEASHLEVMVEEEQATANSRLRTPKYSSIQCSTRILRTLLAVKLHSASIHQEFSELRMGAKKIKRNCLLQLTRSNTHTSKRPKVKVWLWLKMNCLERELPNRMLEIKMTILWFPWTRNRKFKSITKSRDRLKEACTMFERMMMILKKSELNRKKMAFTIESQRQIIWTVFMKKGRKVSRIKAMRDPVKYRLKLNRIKIKTDNF